MSYTIKIRLVNDTDDTLTLVEKTCWWGHSTVWTEPEGGHLLSIAASGTSGMLRFRNSDGDFFALAVGVHNNARWCDVVVDLADDAPLTQLHSAYYNDSDPKGKVKWNQASQASATNSKGKTVALDFYQADGYKLLASVTYS
jgi:hypothetical protein